MPELPEKDWTQGPARFVAACVLGLAGVGGLVWTIMGGDPPRDGEVPPPAAEVIPAVAGPGAAEGAVGGGSDGDASVLRRRSEAGDDAGPVEGSAPGDEEEPAEGQLADGQPAPVLARVIDVNAATAAQLEQLPRIGPTLAQRIVDERDRNGPFRSLDDLTRVRGIGEKTVEGLRGLATVR